MARCVTGAAPTPKTATRRASCLRGTRADTRSWAGFIMASSSYVCFSCDDPDIVWVDVFNLAWCQPCLDYEDECFARMREEGWPRHV